MMAVPLRLSRFETLITGAIVVAIAVSALVTEPLRRGAVSLCVPERTDAEGLERVRAALERALGRSVQLHAGRDRSGDGCELVVMSVHDWRALAGDVRPRPVAVVAGARGAALISGEGGPRALADVVPDEILFTAPHSLDGCWIQLESLRRVGFSAPLEALRFAPAPGRAERVVFEVALGRVPAGAVPGDVLEGMLREGLVAEGEVRIIDLAPGVPEVLLCRPAESDVRVDALVREGLRPVTADDLERIDALFRMAADMGWE